MISHSKSFTDVKWVRVNAEGIIWLLDNHAARFVCGNVLFVDAGQDAMIRPDQF